MEKSDIIAGRKIRINFAVLIFCFFKYIGK